MQFAIVNREQRIAGDRQLDHLQALLCVGLGLRAVRRHVVRQQRDAIQTHFGGQRFHRPQVAVVDRVKGAAEQRVQNGGVFRISGHR